MSRFFLVYAVHVEPREQQRAGINSFPANNYDLSGRMGKGGVRSAASGFNHARNSKTGRIFNLGVGVFLKTGRPYSLTDRTMTIITSAPLQPGPPELAGTRYRPGYAEYDLRWFRDFKLAPSQNEVAPTLTVSVDAFNIFNQRELHGLYRQPQFAIFRPAPSAHNLQDGYNSRRDSPSDRIKPRNQNYCLITMNHAATIGPCGPRPVRPSRGGAPGGWRRSRTALGLEEVRVMRLRINRDGLRAGERGDVATVVYLSGESWWTTVTLPSPPFGM